ncbi:hypothetical protein FIBSPDRAFT_945599 [Athelia psychrophila]|uniref:Uncharacterized protein n=1 Tax=Athelia psychrophila TaxID=1759441 RepID=A0A166TJ27_9AGAM|nr:hypothetical protein FIBSPDRAFT_945599 [Fibularhizoctonia sp. CBS 109695]
MSAVENSGRIGGWLERNHKTIEKDEKNSETYHVFIIQEKSLLKSANDTKLDIAVNIPIGPVILQFTGWVDTATFDVLIDVDVKIPFLPAVRIGELKGNLKAGISITFGVAGITGEITLYLQGQCIFVSFTLTVFSKKYTGNFKLFCLPGQQALE